VSSVAEDRKPAVFKQCPSSIPAVYIDLIWWRVGIGR
jgi:hypothetical protein